MSFHLTVWPRSTTSLTGFRLPSSRCGHVCRSSGPRVASACQFWLQGGASEATSQLSSLTTFRLSGLNGTTDVRSSLTTLALHAISNLTHPIAQVMQPNCKARGITEKTTRRSSFLIEGPAVGAGEGRLFIRLAFVGRD